MSVLFNLNLIGSLGPPARRVRAAEGRHGEEEVERAGRKRLALWNPLLHPLQSGLHASGQSQAGCEPPQHSCWMLSNEIRRLMCCFLLVTQDNADPVLLGDHDVALASIEKVVVGESNFTFLILFRFFWSYCTTCFFLCCTTSKLLMTAHHSSLSTGWRTVCNLFLFEMVT